MDTLLTAITHALAAAIGASTVFLAYIASIAIIGGNTDSADYWEGAQLVASLFAILLVLSLFVILLGRAITI